MDTRSLFSGVSLVVALVFVVSCSGGGGGGGGPGMVTDISGVTISPPDQGFVAGPGRVTFQLTDTNDGSAGAVYGVTVYDNADGSTVLDSVSGLAADGNGSVSWTTGVSLSANRPYYWSFSAVYPGAGRTGAAQGTIDSGILTFRVPARSGGIQAISPRNGGFMDMNIAGAPQLAVYNYYTFGDVGVAYDFELSINPEMTAIVAAAADVAQRGDMNWTDWAIDPGSFGKNTDEFAAGGLIPDRTYYWRAKTVAGGYNQGWSNIQTFTVKNICQAQGSRYAEYVAEWTRVRACDKILRTDTSAALGASDAGGYVSQDEPGWGFVSIDASGALTLELGRAAYDGGGPDIRVFEYYSSEPIEVFVAPSPLGPWTSLGVKWCDLYCDYDLGAGGVPYARFVRLQDRAPATDACHTTSGSDVDAVMALNTVSSDGQCLQ